MKKFLAKKISVLSLGLFLWQFLILPLKSFALSYTPLEPDAFVSKMTEATTFGDFLSQAFQFGLAIAAALAVIMIVWGGVEVMLTESPFGKMNGREKIWNAIWGLVLALVSWLILYTINPDILNFKI